jgi:hypothetical protein
MKLPKATLAAPIAASLLVFGLTSMAMLAENLIPNPDFEKGREKWGLWVAPDSQKMNCQFLLANNAAYSGRNCVQLVSDDFARFSIAANLSNGNDNVIPVEPGDRYRVSAWVRGDTALKVQSGAPGFLIRCEFFSHHKGVRGGLAAYIGLHNKVSIQFPAQGLQALALPGDFPTEWTKVEGVFEVPDTVKELDGMTPPSLFSWYSKGSIFVDDIVFEKVDQTVPLSPLVNEASAKNP